MLISSIISQTIYYTNSESECRVYYRDAPGRIHDWGCCHKNVVLMLPGAASVLLIHIEIIRFNVIITYNSMILGDNWICEIWLGENLIRKKSPFDCGVFYYKKSTMLVHDRKLVCGIFAKKSIYVAPLSVCKLYMCKIDCCWRGIRY